eukprot:TRINITY_DN29339_c0_g1_i1.p3 TRINITY_DN29339_c0_g1~~TRINITY_DN29339_c0_g1_i1.p3  ORF type:complete len:186 (-),score=22.75 TRINITY_DN29339_c0_g1_i1:1431-1988(-)
MFLCSRAGLWTSFGINAALSIIYAIVGFVTFSNILNFQKSLESDAFTTDAMKGLLATTFLSSLIVCVFVLASLFLMIGNFVGRGFGFVYGFVCSSAFNLSVALLISAMQIYYYQDFFEKMEKWYSWSESKTSAFTATFAMAFILFIWYILYFVHLLFSGSALDQENNTTPYQTSKSAAAKDSDMF